ncbi:8-amino-7-oxononanoate synthase [Desulfomicrobium norvegicum]|uniref:8-amino-7-oxononanoate synthase n=1 Tax=Desulfomicrobium norvegicum (strain DSM 1741 / NCIMB 8310) TaxID=52561 RepID=A0A8G2C3N7_DESNO|nr:8-amino-7-oxononanoate synthase [Desulfomicrobium norvegicum]SFL73490.1 8-amino-7-oxononanoate synthase [Desulfomicrobium norvegicum]
MPEHNFLERLKNETEARRQAGLGRELLPVTEYHGSSVVLDGRAYLNFSSNDFLGLAQDRELAETLAQLCRRCGSGSGASRLVTGTTRSTLDAEQALADYFGYESCLILGSGFLANLTLISTLFSERDTLLLDKRAHTSTVAGVRHSRARFHTFRHNRMSHLNKLLKAYPADAVLTESLFSMDGDSPDFAALADLKDENGFLCIVDEAHAFGVLGPDGRGLGRAVADVAVGTLGKAFGMFGAFILCPRAVREHLIHFGQGFIYTTSLPPWHGDMVLAMLDRIGQSGAQREHLRLLGNLARKQLPEAGLQVRGAAHILALEVGDENRCRRLAAALREAGILVFAARYPTVPLGQAILRVCLTAEHHADDISRLRDALSGALHKEGEA